jgi:hypothetical protein
LHAKHLSLKLFDLPPVLELAKATFQSKGLIDRLDLCPGNFLHTPCPKGLIWSLWCAWRMTTLTR